jgi:hypothetical protein
MERHKTKNTEQHNNFGRVRAGKNMEEKENGGRTEEKKRSGTAQCSVRIFLLISLSPSTTE